MSNSIFRIVLLSTTLCSLPFFIVHFVSSAPQIILSSNDHPSKVIERTSPSSVASPGIGGLIANSKSFLLCLQQSDIVAVGTLRSISGDQEVVQQIHGRSYKGHERQAILELQTIYKGGGTFDRNITFYYFEPEEFLGYDKPQLGEVCLYFLKTDKEKRITPFSPYFISFPVLEHRPKLQKLASPTEAVEAELIQNIQQGNEDIIIESLKVLWKSERGIELCRTQLSNHKSFPVKTAALAYRLRCQDKDALDDTILLIKEMKNTNVIGDNVSLQKQMIQTLSLEIPNMVSIIKPNQAEQLLQLRVPGMEREPGAKYKGIESAIGEILRRVTVGEVKRSDLANFAPVAIELLKSGENIDARYDAFQMLSNLRDVDGPGTFEFADNIQKYVKEYSDWWIKEGNRKYGNEEKGQNQ